MAELTLNDYRSRLEILSQKAYEDGKQKVSEFTEHLLKQDNPDLKVFDAIFKYYDFISDNDIIVYNYLIEHNANVEWFYFVCFLSDQRGNIADYFEIIKKCFEKEIKVQKLYSIEKQSDDIKKFAELVENEITHNQSVKESATHNNTVDKRLDIILNELSGIRLNQKNMMKTSISDNQILMDYKLENERLRKELDKVNLSLDITKRKFKAQSSMLEQLSYINDSLASENSNLKNDIEELTQKYETILQECTVHIDTINNLKLKIETLKSQIQETDTYKEKESVYDLVQPEYGKDFVIDNESSVESYVNEPDITSEEPFMTELEDLDYDSKNLIDIKNNKKEIKKHSNIFVDIIARHFEKKFIKKSIAEQENLIFIKMMENDYKQETVRTVKSALKNNKDLSRVDLYKIIISQQNDEDILIFCNNILS